MSIADFVDSINIELWQNSALISEFQSVFAQILLFADRLPFQVSPNFRDQRYNLNIFNELELKKKIVTLNLLRMQSVGTDHFLGMNGSVQETLLLKRMLEKMNWHLLDPSVLNQAEEGDILEVYDANAIQVYRSWNFFQYCSYSILDILTHDWAQLYERPKDIESRLWQIFNKIFKRELNTFQFKDFGIGTYLVIERKFPTEMVFNFTMKYASPIYNANENICAFLSTGSIVPMPIEKESSSIHFI